MVRFLSAALLISAPAALVAMSADGATQSVNPGSAWCGVVNAAAPGDTIVFAAGIYTGTCSITASGSLAAPITLRSQTASAADRAVLAYPGTSSNIIDVYGSYLVFRWLTFGPTAPGAGVNPLKLRSSVQGIVVDQNVFQGTDIAVAANSSGSTYRSISITNNVLTNMQSTGLYFGCHDGTSCHALDILIQGNLIDTVQPGDGVGYGLEIKLNSWATILENTVYDPQGPGIEVYGSNRGDPPSVVERNYVEGSRNDAGINVGGGPAIVRNNIVVGNAYNGIWAQDYAGRGLQQNVWIVENTALANQTGGIKVSNWQAGAGNILAFNAVAPLLGTPALTPASPIADTLLGNVACVPAASCFVQPVSAPYDLWPLSGGPLDRSGRERNGALARRQRFHVRAAGNRGRYRGDAKNLCRQWAPARWRQRPARVRLGRHAPPHPHSVPRRGHAQRTRRVGRSCTPRGHGAQLRPREPVRDPADRSRRDGERDRGNADRGRLPEPASGRHGPASGLDDQLRARPDPREQRGASAGRGG